MTLRKINWRKLDRGWMCVSGTINRNRVIFIHQTYKNRFEVVITLNTLPTYTDFIDTDDLKVAKKETIKLLTEYINKVNDEIKSLSI